MIRCRLLSLAALLWASGRFLPAQNPVDPAAQSALQAAITRLNSQVENLTKLNGDLTKRVGALELDAAPIGSIIAFGGPLASVPSNWRLCNGDPIVRGPDTELLFQAIQTSWGGTQAQVLLPDLRGRFLRGVSLGSGNDPDVGQRTALKAGGNMLDNVGSFQPGQVGKHIHHVTDPGHTHQIQWSSAAPSIGTSVHERTNVDNGGAANSVPTTKLSYTEIQNVDENVTVSAAGENRPPNVAVNWIIRVK